MARAKFTGYRGGDTAATASTAETGTSPYSAIEREIGLVLNRSRGSRKVKRVLTQLIGAAPGASKALTTTRIKAVQGAGNSLVNGGQVQVETVNILAGVTTADDVTRLKGAINRSSRPATYPADKSGYKVGKINSLI